jgi:hypothetical protein
MSTTTPDSKENITQIKYLEHDPGCDKINKFLGGYFTVIQLGISPLTDSIMYIREEGEHLPLNTKATEMVGFNIYGKALIIRSLPELHKFAKSHVGISPGNAMWKYVTSLAIKDKKVLVHAAGNIPMKDVQLVKKHVPVQSNSADPDFDISLQLAFVRLGNPICSCCGKKGKPLMLCQDCCLDWYCDIKCQKGHWSKHRERCCNLGGPLAVNEYQSIAIFSKD